MSAKRSRGGVAEVHQSTIYVDHYRVPTGNAPFADELHNLTYGVVNALATTLVSNFKQNGLGPVQPIKRGPGFNRHPFRRDCPIARPLLVITTPSKETAEPVRCHWGYDPDDFDPSARWTSTEKVANALRGPLTAARVQILRDQDALDELAMKDGELEGIVRDHVTPRVGNSSLRMDSFTPSSNRLAIITAAVGRDILVRECELLGLANYPALPSVEIGGLEIWREGRVIQARPCEAGI